MSKMLDKYDEDGQQWAKELLETLSDELAWSGGIPDSRWIEVVGAGIAMRLRSAFPPPAEDMMVLVNKIRARDFECGLDDEIISSWFKLDDKQAAAEISRFAQSRVEPWREVAKAMCDSYKQGHDCGDWGNWDLEQDMPYVNLRALLSDSPAKEAEK